MKKPDLLPFPRSFKFGSGVYLLPKRAVVHFEADLPRETVLLPLFDRVKALGKDLNIWFELVTGPSAHPQLAISARVSTEAPNRPEGYKLVVGGRGITVLYRAEGGLRAAIATLRQLLREYGRRLPRLTIVDYPDFPRRGVMLDISRGRVPKLETLIELVEDLADFKVNEFQLYMEHTFAYRNYEPVWQDWGALTGEEILRLDDRCRELGIELIPNQNSFGHLRYWLEYDPLKRLSEVPAPYKSPVGDFLRYPTTLAPNHPGTLPFLGELFDELLPHFSSRLFNVGCDETWDLGRGQSKRLCERRGKGRVYLEFLKKIHREVSSRRRQMMFWGDIILHHPELISELPKDVIALNWGYEANHPFAREAGLFADSNIPFYVCPGTSTWMTLIGRLDNAMENLRRAAKAGLTHGAIGYLNTDWGDGGHPQPLAVSYLPYAAGAALSWCYRSFDEKMLIPVLSRDIFRDPTRRLAEAVWKMGFAHLKFKYFAPNVTPFGTVIAAPPPRLRELVCRDGLKYYARIDSENIRSALQAVLDPHALLKRAQPSDGKARLLQQELDLAARMAAQSCHIMLWQQALAANKRPEANRMAKRGIADLRALDQEFKAYWPSRNKGTTKKCSAFLQWRIEDYRASRLHFPPGLARATQPPVHPAE